MSAEVSDARSCVVQRFWHKYLSFLEKASVPEGSGPYYRKAIEAYIEAHPGYCLAAHGSDDIDGYLAGKGRQQGHLQEWRFRRIGDAPMC